MALVALALMLLAACACIEPRRLVEANKSTPRATLDAFQAYVEAGELYDQEYSCFSHAFVDQHGFSLFTYSEFRDRQPWLKWFAKADVLAEREGLEGEHWFDVGVAGRTLRVRMVREDFWGISRGDELVNGREAFEEVVEIERLPGDRFRVTLELPPLKPEPGEFEPSQATSITAERLWKIDSVLELPDPSG